MNSNISNITNDIQININNSDNVTTITSTDKTDRNKQEKEEDVGVPTYNDVWAIVVFLFIVITTLILASNGFIKVLIHGRPEGVKDVLKDIATKYSSSNNTMNEFNNFNSTKFINSTINIIEDSRKIINSTPPYQMYSNSTSFIMDKKYIFIKRDEDLNNNEEVIQLPKIIFAVFIYQLCIFFPLCVSIFYYILILKFTGKMIAVSFILFFISFNGILGTIIAQYIIRKSKYCILYIILLIGFNIISFGIFRKWRSKVKFAKVVLRASVIVMKNYLSTIFVGYFTSAFGAIWSFCIAFAIYGLVIDLFYTDDIDNSTSRLKYFNFFLLVYVAFSYLYVKSVIQNLVHVTISAVYALFIFSSTKKKNGDIKINLRDPTYNSFKRSISTSFGSICFGSLVIVIVEWIKRFINWTNKILTCSYLMCCCCCLEYLVELLDNALKYFNSYAFVYVAIYGTSFRKSSKESFKLMNKYGIDAVLNDVIVSRVLLVGKVTIIFISSISAYFICKLASNIYDSKDIMMHIVVAFTTSETIFSAVTSVLQSAVSTLFVGICNDLKSLKITQPEFYNEITKLKPDLRKEINIDIVENVNENGEVLIAKTFNIFDDMV